MNAPRPCLVPFSGNFKLTDKQAIAGRTPSGPAGQSLRGRIFLILTLRDVARSLIQTYSLPCEDLSGNFSKAGRRPQTCSEWAQEYGNLTAHPPCAHYSPKPATYSRDLIRQLSRAGALPNWRRA